jgi:hypothetical protein
MTISVAPRWEQFVILILGPPIMTSVWWLSARAWALSIQGESASQKTKSRQKLEFTVILVLMYAIALAFALYAWLK